MANTPPRRPQQQRPMAAGPYRAPAPMAAQGSHGPQQRGQQRSQRQPMIGAPRNVLMALIGQSRRRCTSYVDMIRKFGEGMQQLRVECNDMAGEAGGDRGLLDELRRGFDSAELAAFATKRHIEAQIQYELRLQDALQRWINGEEPIDYGFPELQNRRPRLPSHGDDQPIERHETRRPVGPEQKALPQRSLDAALREPMPRRGPEPRPEPSPERSGPPSPPARTPSPSSSEEIHSIYGAFATGFKLHPGLSEPGEESDQGQDREPEPVNGMKQNGPSIAAQTEDDDSVSSNT